MGTVADGHTANNMSRWRHAGCLVCKRIWETPHTPRPMTRPQVLLGLAASSGGAGNSPAALRSMVAQETVVGLFRDLRGITLATNSRRTYGARRAAQTTSALLSGCATCDTASFPTDGIRKHCGGLAERLPLWLKNSIAAACGTPR